MLSLNSHKDIAFPEIIKKYLKKYMETFAFNFIQCRNMPCSASMTDK